LDEDGRQIFLAAWLRYRSESECLCFDITKVSSYFALNEHVKYGENRDGKDLRQLNLALLFGQKSMLPVYYRELPRNISDFNGKLLTSQWELESGELVPEHEEFYKWYFTVRETPKRGRLITINAEAVKEHQNKYCGYYTIFTNDVKDPVLALRIYRDKDAVEKCVGGLKNQLDMKRLRTHGRFSGRYGKLLTETIKVQREMMESLGVPAETWLQK